MADKEKKPREGPKEETPWERFERLAKGIVAVPKEAVKEPPKDKQQAT